MSLNLTLLSKYVTRTRFGKYKRCYYSSVYQKFISHWNIKQITTNIYVNWCRPYHLKKSFWTALILSTRHNCIYKVSKETWYSLQWKTRDRVKLFSNQSTVIEHKTKNCNKKKQEKKILEKESIKSSEKDQ